VSPYVLAIYIKKYHKAKEEIMKIQNISPCKKYNLQKIKTPL